jgi:hypothetical protein
MENHRRHLGVRFDGLYDPAKNRHANVHWKTYLKIRIEASAEDFLKAAKLTEVYLEFSISFPEDDDSLILTSKV